MKTESKFFYPAIFLKKMIASLLDFKHQDFKAWMLRNDFETPEDVAHYFKWDIDDVKSWHKGTKPPYSIRSMMHIHENMPW